MRGPGDFEGTRQSGLALDLHIADLAKDSPMLEDARSAAIDILTADPTLENPLNTLLRKNIENFRTQTIDYSKIS
jgi:ATP-dependent DNA helicase RecG